MSTFFQTTIIIVMIILAICMLFALVRVVKGPSSADRMVAVNMIGTMTMVIILLLSILLGEEYLMDVAVVYAMLSFLAVIVLSKVFVGAYREKHLLKEQEEEK